MPVLLLLLTLIGSAPAWAAPDEDLLSLGLLAAPPEQVISPARSPRPSSKIAENVTVITSEQIEALNVHTLAEVLNTIPGVQVQQSRTPATSNFVFIDGAPFLQIQVLIDGVPQNRPGENLADVAHIPIQHIERIEVIKGAASAAWGSALGGVVNVITKSPATQKSPTGSVTASMGTSFTTDTHGEVSGSADRFGYYLSAGYLHSDGLLPHNALNFSNAYSKFVYELPGNGSVTFGADFRSQRGGVEEVPLLDIRDSGSLRSSYFFLNLNRKIGDRLTLDLLGRLSRHDTETRWGSISTPELVHEGLARDMVRGAEGKLIWGGSDTNVTTGIVYERVDARALEGVDHSVTFDKSFDRFGLYTNAALSWRRFTLLPGIRFDHTGQNGDITSYTVGATYRLTDETILRGYWARGYSLPKAQFDHAPQKVWTVQGGIETSEIPFLWVKGTYFYNKTWDTEDGQGTPDTTDQIREGFEVEARTVPVWNLSLGAGYTLSDIRFEQSGAPVSQMPKHVVKVMARYDNKDLGLNAVLTGNLARWSSTKGSEFGDPGRDNNFIWDLTLTKKVSSSEFSPELFFSGHNLFDTPDYLNSMYKNAGRWFEGGVRCRF